MVQDPARVCQGWRSKRGGGQEQGGKQLRLLDQLAKPEPKQKQELLLDQTQKQAQEQVRLQRAFL